MPLLSVTPPVSISPFTLKMETEAYSMGLPVNESTTVPEISQIAGILSRPGCCPDRIIGVDIRKRNGINSNLFCAMGFFVLQRELIKNI